MIGLSRALTISNPSLRSCRRLATSSAPILLTREMFISPNYVKIAASRPTIYKATADGKGVTEVPIPANVRETGTIPDGYSVG